MDVHLLTTRNSSSLEIFPSLFVSITCITLLTSSLDTCFLFPSEKNTSLTTLTISLPSRNPDLSVSYCLYIYSTAFLTWSSLLVDIFWLNYYSYNELNKKNLILYIALGPVDLSYIYSYFFLLKKEQSICICFSCATSKNYNK